MAVVSPYCEKWG